MWEVRQVESGSQRSREGNGGTGRGGRGKPPGAGAGGGGLSMETVFGSTTGITHGGLCAHVRAPRAMSAHAPQSPRNSGSSQKRLHNRCHTLEGMGTMEFVSGGGRGTGVQKDQQLRCTPCSLRAPWDKKHRAALVTHPTSVSCALVWVRTGGNHKKHGPCPSGQPVSLSGERDHRHITTQ